MDKKLLADLEFSSIIGESTAQTVTGQNLINKYKSYLMTNESTCRLVNRFVYEANQHLYDNGVHEAMGKVADYIQCNKTGWALLTACENLKQDTSSRNFLNKAAVVQVEKLLENNEETINKYIKAGALKNVMYVTEFRNIAKQVYHDMPMVESDANYTMVRPISYIENCGDGYMFEAAGKVIKVNEDKTIMEANWNDVSNTFRMINQLLESSICKFDEVSESLTISYLGAEYVLNIVDEACKCEKCRKNEKGECKKKEMTVEQLREENRLVVMAQQPRNRNMVAGVLEAIALAFENFKHIAKMDNAGVYMTNADQFLVVNEGTNMFATLIKSNHSNGWTFNTNVIEALENIKKSTRVTLSEKFTEQVKAVIENTSEEEKAKIAAELKESQKNGMKARIEALTEKFKNDPTKLAILSQCAKDLQEAED